jgi:hypothetical protein
MACVTLRKIGAVTNRYIVCIEIKAPAFL